MKGKDKVLSEVYTAFSLYNLRRSVSIVGILRFLKRLKAVLQLFFDKLDLGRVMMNTVALKNNYDLQDPASLI